MFKIYAADKDVEKQYQAAREMYAVLNIDTDDVLNALDDIEVSVNCWQGDDVKGFEHLNTAVDAGGIMATGDYPGAARNGDELRQDALKAFSLIPGPTRFNLHAIYAEPDPGEKIDRDRLLPQHFSRWMEWSQMHNINLDFNDTFFAHPQANSGYTLSHPKAETRDFWIRHAVACRHIAVAFGSNQNSHSFINHWIPDGAKDQPMDRWSPRQRLLESLDEIFQVKIDPDYCIDSLESKLFGIGSEDYVVGSHEFYLGYVLTHKNVYPCLDMGHFHPTETIHDKISALLTFTERLIIHVSRGIRWDSDHVVIFNEDLKRVLLELVRGNALKSSCIALDFFDGSMNRVGAWVTGTRATQKAIMYALLEPTSMLQQMEEDGNSAGKLALLEELKTMPFGTVWDMYCLRKGVPVGPAWITDMMEYDRSTRSRSAGGS